jgi:excisionase family DNA binding protein
MLDQIVTFERRLTFGVAESAKLLGVSIPFIRKEIRLGHLHSIRLGGRVMIRHDELERYIREGEAEAARRAANIATR